MKRRIILLICCIMLAVGSAYAEEVVVQMYLTSSTGVGEIVGTVKASDSPYGTVFTPNINGLSPGLHGFHVHQNPSCDPQEKDGQMVPASAAGGHFDPAGTGKHEGPYGNGHLGDLPALYVDAEGKATHPALAPRIKVSDIKGRSLMIHAGGDNYSDRPEMLGGGGARVACGVVK